MAGNIGLQILRGSKDFDPSTSDKILKDGQLFYSKKNNQLYIGDGEKELQTCKALTSYLEPGSGLCSIQQINGFSDEYKNTTTGDNSLSLGYSIVNEGVRCYALGNANKVLAPEGTTAPNTMLVTGQLNTVEERGMASVINGKQNNAKYMNYSIISGHGNDVDNIAQTWVSGTSNKVKNANSCTIIGRNNTIDTEVALNGAFLSGQYHTGYKDYQTLLGKWTEKNKDTREKVLFAVGNGRGDAKRFNLIQLLEDGTFSLKGSNDFYNADGSINSKAYTFNKSFSIDSSGNAEILGNLSVSKSAKIDGSLNAKYEIEAPGFIINDKDQNIYTILHADGIEINRDGNEAQFVFPYINEEPLANTLLTRELLEAYLDMHLQNTLDTIYPVGAIYLTFNNYSAKDIQQMLGGRWEQLSPNMTLWLTSSELDDAGSYLESALPDPQTSFNVRSGKVDMSYDYGNQGDRIVTQAEATNVEATPTQFNIKATNEIYGKSDIVQPPAIKIYGWRRIS